MPPKKKPVKKVVHIKPQKNRDEVQINIQVDLDNDKKINVVKVFEGYTKEPKSKGPKAKKK
tara:strand:+ start:79 stop:261 length:183 start_codon:yes stop_codon:yes gene_type:complete